MNKKLLAGLGLSAMLMCGTISSYAEELPSDQTSVSAIMTNDSLLTIKLPSAAWYQVISEENTEMFSNGNCAIIVNLYKNGDTLPAVQSADENHAMIYTAAASTKEYVLYVVGYANAQEDFAGICDAVNSIKVDSTKITADMLNHTITTEDYRILELNYTAWVSAEGLNVRSTSAADGGIVTSLVRGDQVTVTGSVTKNGVEIGWARIKTPDGTEGYVSSEFLNTTPVNAAEVSTETKNTQSSTSSASDVKYTGKTTTVYGSSGAAYTLHECSDGQWRADSGTIYERITDFDWVNANGDVLYVNKPEGAGSYRTGYSITLYHANGSAVIAYEYADGSWIDDYGVAYSQMNMGEWQGNYTGETLYAYDPTAGSNYTADVSEETHVVTSEEGDVRVLSFVGSDVWVDDRDTTFWRYNSYGTWVDENGIYYYE